MHAMAPVASILAPKRRGASLEDGPSLVRGCLSTSHLAFYILLLGNHRAKPSARTMASSVFPLSPRSQIIAITLGEGVEDLWQLLGTEVIKSFQRIIAACLHLASVQLNSDADSRTYSPVHARDTLWAGLA